MNVYEEDPAHNRFSAITLMQRMCSGGANANKSIQSEPHRLGIKTPCICAMRVL